jgi:LacI family transcriptional regulator
VGKVTVSYVLNGHSKINSISEETQKRVLLAAKDLEYQPNALARSLVTQRTDIIAVVFQSGSYFKSWSGFTCEVMSGIAEATGEAGFDLLLHTKAALDPYEEANALADGRVDGALMLRDENDPTLLRLVSKGFPCVQFFTHNDGLDVPWVDCDNFTGGKIATQHLLDLGHTRIAMLAGAPGSVSSNQRLAGFRAAMADAGLDVRPDWQLVGVPSLESAIDLFRSEDRPSAIFVWSDDVAVALVAALSGLGLSVPDDVSVVGFDSSSSAETCVPALTSVRQPIREMANLATQMLIKVARKKPLAERQVMIQPTLNIRASTAVPKGRAA